MKHVKQRIEDGFERFAALVCRQRFLVLFLSVAVAAGFASGLRNITIDTSNEAFLHEDDPVLKTYNAFREQFGRDDVVIVEVAPDALFTTATLRRIEALHDDLKDNVPHLADITSMVNARDTRGEADRLVVGDLLETMPETPAEMAAFKAHVLANPLYRNQLVSADGKVTAIVLELATQSGGDTNSVESALAGFDDTPQTANAPHRLTDEETHDVVAAVEKVVARHQAKNFVLRVAGTPAVTDTLKRALQSDVKRFIALAIAMIAVLLFAMFRSPAAVILPLVVVVLSVLSTVGLMGHVGVAVKLPTIILPSFLLAVGVGASVHLLAMFYRGLGEGRDRTGAIVYAVGHSGLPIVLTSLTTAAGLGSFSTAEVAPVADLGRFASFGVLLALVYTLTLLPAGLAIWPARARAPRTGTGRLDDALVGISEFSVRHPMPIVVVSLLLVAGASFYAAQLRFSHDVLAWLPDEWAVHQGTRAVDRDLGGSVALEVVVDTGRENGLYDRDTLVKLDTLARDFEAHPFGTLTVGKASSVADMLKEIHQALNENRPDFYKIPENQKLIPQEFLLFENSGSDDLENVVDSRFQLARFSLRVPWRDTLAYVPFMAEVTQRFERAFDGKADLTITGVMSLFSRTVHAAIHSAAKSYVIAFGVITLMMIALIGRLGVGLISMIPNIAPIVVTLGLMKILNIPLNMFTMLVGSIAIGLAVDDTVHFMHHFHRYLERTGDITESVRQTLLTSGRAMLATSVVLAAGFFIFMFASMHNLIQFGFLTGVTVLLALLADFMLAPALMALRYRRRVPATLISQTGDR